MHAIRAAILWRGQQFQVHLNAEIMAKQTEKGIS
jgi:hypothetical protein